MARDTGTIRKVVNKTADENGGKATAYGFIKSEKGEDLFFLPSHLQQTQATTWDGIVALTKAGQWPKVEFTAIDHQRPDGSVGRRAIDVLVR